jgi:hypothetical protein
MSIATLNIRTTPRRMLTVREAAEYCGMVEKRFPIDCTVKPVAMPNSAKRYDMVDLDRWIEGQKSEIEMTSAEAMIARLG